MGREEELMFIIKMRDEASRIIDNFNDSVEDTGEQADKATSKFDRMAAAAKQVAAATASMYASVQTARAAVNTFARYETGLLNVAKTTNLSGRELQNFENRFDSLAATMAVPIESLQQIAATAGQLGIQGTDNLLKFTETVAKLETASDLTGEAASFALARITAVTGEGVDGAERLANVLVGLGNNFAATESQIVRITQEIARSTSVFGLSSTTIAAFGAAFAQTGGQAEISGTAIGKTLRNLALAAAEGGEGMEALTRLTGLSQKEFNRLVKEQPEKALTLFLESLQPVIDDTATLNEVLEDLGLKSEEINKTIIPLAANYDILSRALGVASESAADMSALNDEYTQFAQSFSSETQKMRNSFSVFMKEVGAAIVPVLIPAIKGLGDVFDALALILKDLPDGVDTILVGLTAMVPVVYTLITALRILGVTITAASFANPVLLLAAALTGAAATFGIARLRAAEYRETLDLAKNSMDSLVESQKIFDSLFTNFIDNEGGSKKAAEAVKAAAQETIKQLQIQIDAARLQVSQLEDAQLGRRASRREPERAQALKQRLADARDNLDQLIGKLIETEGMVSAVEHNMLTMGNAAKRAVQQAAPEIVGFNAELQTFNELTLKEADSIEDLTEKFGALAGVVASVRDRQQEVAAAQADASFDNQLGAIARLVTEVEKGDATLEIFLQRLQILQQGDSFTETAHALESMAKQIALSNGGVDKLKGGALDLYLALLDSSNEAATLAIKTGQVSLFGAVSEAERLANELGISVGLANMLVSTLNNTDVAIANMDANTAGLEAQFKAITGGASDADAAVAAFSATLSSKLQLDKLEGEDLIKAQAALNAQTESYRRQVEAQNQLTKLTSSRRSSTKAARSESQDYVSSIVKEIEALETKTAALKMVDEVQEKYNLTLEGANRVSEIIAEAQAMGLLTSQTDKLAAAYARAFNEQEKIKGGTKSFYENLQLSFDQFAKALEDTSQLTTNIVESMASVGTRFLDRMFDQNQNFFEALRGAAADTLSDIARMLLDHAIKVLIFKHLLGIGTGSFNGIFDAFLAKGGVVDQSGVQAFANGSAFSNGVVNSPTMFGFGNNGLGVMGEAGPEAVMPLSRDGSGRLGVNAAGLGVSMLGQVVDAITSGFNRVALNMRHQDLAMSPSVSMATMAPAAMGAMPMQLNYTSHITVSGGQATQRSSSNSQSDANLGKAIDNAVKTAVVETITTMMRPGGALSGVRK